MKLNNAIGGYFSLELSQKRNFHKNGIHLNTGRNAFELIITTRNYKKIFIPHYTCEVILEPLEKHQIEYEYYYIDQNLDPLDLPELKKHEAFLYTNYFGIKNHTANMLTTSLRNLILDNSQAFYHKPPGHVDAFYSPRKFFGVSDGGVAILYGSKPSLKDFKQDISFQRMSHLLKRIDISPEMGYDDFVKNDAALSNQPIKRMSKITEAILRSIDYKKNKSIREDNFNYLHARLSSANEMPLPAEWNNGPMVYPLLVKHKTLRSKLIEKKVYVATYWENVMRIVAKDSTEAYLSRYLIPLPVDQRYSRADMERLVELVLGII